MSITRRSLLAGAAVSAAALPGLRAESGVKHYVRYRSGPSNARGYGELEGDAIYPIEGSVLGKRERKGDKIALSDVKLLFPVRSPKVFAVGLNYKSHLGSSPAPEKPEIFYKPTTSLQNPGDPIVIPSDAKNLHYEAEFVVVVGKAGKNISESEAADHILGYTCGNDVSERDWQQDDLQWWRAKGCDTFGPMGPSIAVGLDYMDSEISLRLNGETKQEQKVSDLLYKPEQIVSFISKHVRLAPGDSIFTGTPGSTSAMKHGDVCEVEVTGVGILRNRVRKARA
ncbi:MAG: fumarylacetoacetate hydrolase family protein [Bryobacterales bacterium]|nr:fumarylacetoacetate hydrolase family protein [Bryobacterales bacterium]